MSGISQTSKGIHPQEQDHTYGIPTLGLQLSSVVSLCVGPLPTRIIVPPIASTSMISVNDHKKFEIYLLGSS